MTCRIVELTSVHLHPHVFVSDNINDGIRFANERLAEYVQEFLPADPSDSASILYYLLHDL